MDYNSRKTELLNKQKKVMQKHKELLMEVCELVVGLQELLEDQNKSFHDTVDWMHYMTRDEDVDKSFRLAAALQYVERPDDVNTIKNLKSDMKTNKVKMKMPISKKPNI